MIQHGRFYYLVMTLLFLLHSTPGFSGDCDASGDELDNGRIIANIYQGFETGDMDAILGNMSEDIIWLHPGHPEQIPFAGEFVGKAGVRRFFDTAFSRIEVLDQKIHSVLEDGDKVIAVGFEHMRVKANGKEYQSNWIHMYTLKDGKVVAFEEFIDTAALVAAFSPG